MSKLSEPARIVHFTSVHLWHDTRIFARMCRSIARQEAYVVHLVAACDDKQDVELYDGVYLHPVPRRHGRLARMWNTGREVCRTAFRLRGDIYHFHDPELIPHALWMAARGGCVIYDVHEDVPKDLIDKQWLHPIVRRALVRPIDWLERLSGSRFAAVIAADEEIEVRFQRLAKHTCTLANYPYLADFEDYEDDSPKESPPMLVSFGGVSRLRAIEPMVDALALLPAELNVRLVVSGRCDSDELMNRLRKSPGFSRFEYQGWLPHAAMRSLLKRASIAMNLFSNAPINRRVRSNRFFESMAYGIPVLTANFPYWREIVERIGCGLTVDPEDPRDIARAVTFLLTHPAEAHAMGQRGRQAVVEQMNWETECGKLFQLYDRLLAERRR